MGTCATTCPYCGVGCGVSATVEDSQVIAVSGDEQHPANGGRLCVKGTALAETFSVADRLLQPQLRGTSLDWGQALDTVAEKMRAARDQYGPKSIAFYLSGQLLTEDYYVANKLLKGFLGSANVDTNSRLCMSSAVAAHKRAFGEDIVPCTYQDLETCDLLVMVGSNAAWTHPVVYQRIVAAKQRNPRKRVVVIDTRSTTTCDVADLHLQLAPGSDAFLFGGLLNYLAHHELCDRDYLTRCTEGFDDSLAAVADLSVEAVARATGLSPSALLQFYQWFGATRRTVTLYSQGINQSATGTDKCNAIINCHLATGRIGEPGMGPFSITGQPNAMGGREVGGLANQLAAHMDFKPADVDRVGRFWNAPDMASEPGLKAVDLFRAAADGQIKFLWIMATNPAVSLPDSALVRAALERCEFVVLSDCSASTDTAAMADLLLPAAGWGEKDGTVTNSERVISRQRRLVESPGDARPDWWMVTEVAHRLGFGDAFDYDSPADIFREHAQLSAFENEGSRAFDIGGLAALSDAEYEQLAPRRWPLPAGMDAVEPLADGRFFTPSGRARLVPVTAQLPDSHSGLTVNTGRLRDQWHTMTRTGQVPRLARHRDFFSLSLNPHDARKHGLAEGDLARLRNDQGEVCGLVSLDDGLPRGQVFVPIHWSGTNSAAGRISELIPAEVDPVSGQPQSKYAGAGLQAVAPTCWGMLYTREAPVLEAIAYWSRIPLSGGFLTLLADGGEPAAVQRCVFASVGEDQGQILSYSDSGAGDLRSICRDADGIRTALYLHPQRTVLPQQEWLADLAGEQGNRPDWELLGGFSAATASCGRLVCSCHEVGEHTIVEAIDTGACSVEALGQALRCGTQCGSCVPELKSLLAARARDCAA